MAIFGRPERIAPSGHISCEVHGILTGIGARAIQQERIRIEAIQSWLRRNSREHTSSADSLDGRWTDVLHFAVGVAEMQHGPIQFTLDARLRTGNFVL